MEKCRKIQYPMMESTAKQNVPGPGRQPVHAVGDVHRVGRAHHDEHGEDDPARPGPRLMPMASARVNDSAVDVWAQCTASSAKASAQTSCAADFPRLFSPRLRRWCTLM